MDDAMKELGRRAIAAGWRPMDGELTLCGLRICDGGDGYAIGHRFGATRDGGGWQDGPYEGMAPDLSDPATLGCLLAQVRERWGDPGLSVGGIYEAGIWVWMFNEGKPHGATFYRARSVRQPSEAAALVAALEAAPKVSP